MFISLVGGLGWFGGCGTPGARWALRGLLLVFLPLGCNFTVSGGALETVWVDRPTYVTVPMS